MWEINGQLTNDLELVKQHFGLKHLPMVRSLLDQDMYKFSMGQCYLHQFSTVSTVWDFKARNVGEGKKEKYTEADVEEVKRQLQAYCSLRYTNDELNWLGNADRPWIHKDYVEVLRDWRPHIEDFEVTIDPQTGLAIHFHGVQWKVSYYEIPVLEIAAEVYYRNHCDYEELSKSFKRETEEKIRKVKSGTYDIGNFSEFGARRRVSFELQDWLIASLKEAKIPGFIGTSNVFLAMKHGLKPVGTMAHEFFETMQGYRLYNLAYTNKVALDAWVREYGVMNGIALTDTLGTDIFLRDFKTTFATLFSGVRHDSGDPYDWGHKMIAHYKKLGTDPKQKTLLFSDSLNFEKATNLNKHFKGLINTAFGIGTYLSGPQTIEALNIVCKVVLVDGKDVVKLSDSPGKCMCRNQEYIDYAARTIKWRLEHEE